MAWIVILAMISFVALAIWGNAYYQKKRRAGFAKVAEELGLEIFFDLPEQDWDRFERFDLYKKHGRTQKVNVAFVAETQTTRVSLFEYTVVLRSGNDQKSSKTYVVMMVFDARLMCPRLTLSKRTWSASLSKWIGTKFIEFPEDQEFHSSYLVRGEPEEAVREFLNTDRRNRLVEKSVQELQVDGDVLVLVRPERWLQPSEVKNFFQESLAILNAIL